MRLFFYGLILILSACGQEEFEVEYEITPYLDGTFKIILSQNFEEKVRTTKIPKKFRTNLTSSDHQLGGPQSYTIDPRKSSSEHVEAVDISNPAHYFQLPGDAFLPCAGQDELAQRRIKMVWNTPNANWKIINSFGSGENIQVFKASCKDLTHALYVGGTDFRVTNSDRGVKIAVQGHFNNLHDAILEELVRSNIKKVQDFWGEGHGDYYFVSIRSAKEAMQGSSHHQAFQLKLDLNLKNTYNLNHLIAHEYFHYWNGLKHNLDPLANQADTKWFSEGFTDYFAYGLTINRNRLNQKLAEKRENFDNKPLGHFQIKEDFHFPYVQGTLLANYLDKEIRDYSGKKLSIFLRDFIKRSEQDKNFLLTNENIGDFLCGAGYLECAQAKQIIQDYIIDGHQIP